MLGCDETSILPTLASDGSSSAPPEKPRGSLVICLPIRNLRRPRHAWAVRFARQAPPAFLRSVWPSFGQFQSATRTVARAINRVSTWPQKDQISRQKLAGLKVPTYLCLIGQRVYVILLLGGSRYSDIPPSYHAHAIVTASRTCISEANSCPARRKIVALL